MIFQKKWLKRNERVRFLPKEVQETIQGILQVLDTEYGADRNKYEDDEGYVIVVYVISLIIPIELTPQNLK